MNEGRKTCFACGKGTDAELVMEGATYPLCQHCYSDHVDNNNRAVASLRKQKAFQIKAQLWLSALPQRTLQEA